MSKQTQPTPETGIKQLETFNAVYGQIGIASKALEDARNLARTFCAVNHSNPDAAGHIEILQPAIAAINSALDALGK